MDDGSGNARRHDLDWLRSLAVLLLVPFHGALLFVHDPAYISYVKDARVSASLKAAVDLVYQFHMPLLFFIAGAGAWYALGARSPAAFLRERTLRLLVPFGFGTAVLLPPMLYVQFLWRPDLAGRFRSFWQYYPSYFRLTGDLSGYGGTYSPAHLWFLLFLFVFSAAALPLLLWLRCESGCRFVAAAAALSRRRGAVLLPALPILASMAFPSIGGKNPLYYLTFFLLGYLSASHPTFRAEEERSAGLALAVGAACAPLLVGWLWPLVPRLAPFTWQATLVGLVMALSSWCWVVGLAGTGAKTLNRKGPALVYLNRVSPPFYVLHLPVETFVGYALVRSLGGVWLKFLLLNLLTTALTLLACEALALRTRTLRFLFGVKEPGG